MVERGHTGTSLLLADLAMMADSCNERYDSPQVILDGVSESHLQAADAAQLVECLPNTHKAPSLIPHTT